MEQLFETGQNSVMVYVEEKGNMNLVDRLFNKKEPAAIYYKNGVKFAYHRILHPITIKKMGIPGCIIKSKPEQELPGSAKKCIYSQHYGSNFKDNGERVRFDILAYYRGLNRVQVRFKGIL